MTEERITSLEQRVFLRGYQKIELDSAGDIEITFRQFAVHRQFKVPLWQLIPNPERIRVRAIGSIVGLVTFGLITVGLIGGMVFSRDWGLAGALAVPTVLFGVIVVACLWNLQTKTIDAMVYHFRQGGQMHVWFERPDAGSFHAFCKTLTKEAELAWQHRPADSTQSLAGEIAALKKLVESGTLTESEFQKAKEKLLEAANDRKIGFR